MTYRSLIHELPYFQDSAALFSSSPDNPWTVFLDSAYPHSRQGRYDIFSTDPFIKLTTRGGMTEVRSRSGVRLYPDDPLLLLKEQLGATVPTLNGLPFCGGAIGYFAYDLARRLEILPVDTKDAENIPEMAVGIYDWAVVVDHQERQSWLVGQGRDEETRKKWPGLIERFSRISQPAAGMSGFRLLGKVLSNMDANDYAAAFRRIKHYLHEGDCYQVNLAQRFSAPSKGSAWSAYKMLRKMNPAPFCSYLNFPQVQVLSSSPERFLKVTSGKVETKPIKGTRPRYPNHQEDREQVLALAKSPKDRAENLMIVDLLRNDIGKNCKPGSVHVPKLFDVESFATVHHLVSTICGELNAGGHALDLLRGCFPGGSITGAPKIRAMEIIEELEPHRRGVYCGSIGYIGFDGNMDSNITIRTLVLSDNTIRFWAGGGIVADSDLNEEYQESFDKAAAMLDLLEQVGIDADVDYVGS